MSKSPLVGARALEVFLKIAGLACRIHAFVVHGTVDALAQTGRIWMVILVPGDPCGSPGALEPDGKIRAPAPVLACAFVSDTPA
jgi:hypothetical protein